MGRNHYSSELVETLVKEVLEEQHPLTHVARSVGIHPGVLSKWVKHARARAEAPVCAESTDSEVTNLRIRVDALEGRLETIRGVLEKLLAAKYKV